jgi:hypothetical protein
MLALALLATLSLAFSSAASASDGAATADPSTLPQEWVGRFCPIGGCTGAAGNGLLNAAGFGAAALLAGWWARQRPHLED